MIFAVIPFLLMSEAFGAQCADHYFLSIRVKSKSKCEANHALSTGSGVVSPSNLATIGENPAGLAYNDQLKIHAAAYQSYYGREWNGSLVGVTGKNSIGGGLSAHRYTTNQFQNSAGTLISLGMGGLIDKIKSGFGFSFRPNNDNYYSSPYPEMRTTYTLGSIFNASGTTRFGATVHDIGLKTAMYGFGMSLKAGNSLFLVLDGTSREQFRRFLLKPALGFGFGNFQFSTGFNLAVNSSSSYWSQDTVTAGIAFWTGEWFKLIAYYNRLELFYMGVTASLK